MRHIARKRRPPDNDRWPFIWPAVETTVLGPIMQKARERQGVGFSELSQLVTHYYRMWRPHASLQITPQYLFQLETQRIQTCDPAVACAIALVLAIPWDEVLGWEFPLPTPSPPDLWVLLTSMGLSPEQKRMALSFIEFLRSNTFLEGV